MNNWIILFSFTYPHEAHIAQAKLQSENIETRVRDELTVQVHNFYSNAIGGVKLEVQARDYTRAVELLKESGIIGASETEGEVSNNRFNQFTSGLPFIGKYAAEIRLIVFVAVILLILALILLPFILKARPTVAELITSKTWCLYGLSYQNNNYKLNTRDNTFYFEGCRESLLFDDNGILKLPGFNSPVVKAKWRIENDYLIILNADTFKQVYEGEYAVKVDKNYLVLESQDTRIICASLW